MHFAFHIVRAKLILKIVNIIVIELNRINNFCLDMKCIYFVSILYNATHYLNVILQ